MYGDMQLGPSSPIAAQPQRSVFQQQQQPKSTWDGPLHLGMKSMMAGKGFGTGFSSGFGTGPGTFLGFKGNEPGGFLDSLKDFFMGSPGQAHQFQNYTPQQQMALNQMLSQAMGGLDTGVLEQQARQGFAQQTIPSIAERFSGMGSGGGQRSSAFIGALGSAGAGLETSLAGLRQGRLMQMLQMGMTPQYENMYSPPSSPLGPLLQGAGMALPLMFL